ncbi:MAG: YdiU family protein [Sandaracinus sp.]|nr:YdiU family protein [Sandaracinus sp.]
MRFGFDNRYASFPGRFYARVRPSEVREPAALAINVALAEELGLDAAALASPEGLAILAGNAVPDDADPMALAYAGHQFGSFVPQLGDGRAILLGDLVDRHGRRRDVQLKGSGPTPFSRGGDGRAALGPVLREYVLSEAMHALGVPTTRALAAVLTGEPVYRDTVLPGAVLTRVASSHLRVGTFQFFAARRDLDALSLLVAHALERHYPDADRREGDALALIDAVMKAQAKLVAKWLALGFVHGVMNTDNTSIAGETLDYGPAAFLDAYEPARVFSSIDQNGRYAFAHQPRIALWNLTRLAETVIELVGDDEAKTVATLTERLEAFPAIFEQAYAAELRAKLGLREARDEDLELARDLLGLLAKEHTDYTVFFRRLAHGDAADQLLDVEAFAAWTKRWEARREAEGTTEADARARMLAVNPAFIPRNHRIEEMIAAATAGDLGPFERLHRVLATPFEDQPQDADLATPPGDDQWQYRTFCGT